MKIIICLLSILCSICFNAPGLSAQSWSFQTQEISFNKNHNRFIPSQLAPETISMQPSSLPLFSSKDKRILPKNYMFTKPCELTNNSTLYFHQNSSKMKSSFFQSDWYNKNRRNIYSSIWAYASLNYLYCDLAAFMDADMHNQYHTGTVDGFKMTPGFIAASAAMMQIALTNVFLPQLIKNDKVLRWVQIASGTLMTVIQSATLFAGTPTSYYTVFSGLEIAATAYITLDAIKWKLK